jgi:BMFP domain-containing protein YqiC
MDLPAVTAPSTPADNERLQALEAKINDLSIRLTKTTDVTAPVSADPDMVERLESMAARLAVLEERLADMPTTPSIPAPRPTSESQTAPGPCTRPNVLH